MSAIRLSPLWPLRYATMTQEAPIRALLVADDPALGLSIATTLRAGGVEVLDAGAEPLDRTAAAALALALDAQPDILVSALRRPHRTQLSAITAARRNGWAAPLVVLSASGDWRAQLAAYYSGADVVLAEPLDPEELMITVRGLVPDKG